MICASYNRFARHLGISFLLRPGKALRWLRDSFGTHIAMMVLGAIFLLLATESWADEIKCHGRWIKDIQINSVAEGKLTYIAGFDEHIRPLEEIEALKVDGLTNLMGAEEAFESGDYQKAMAMYALVKSQRDWLEHWVLSRQADAADRTGQPTKAIDLYLKLIRADADPHYLRQSFLKSLVKLDLNQKEQYVARISVLINRLEKDSAARNLMAKILDQIRPNPPQVSRDLQSAEQLDVLQKIEHPKPIIERRKELHPMPAVAPFPLPVNMPEDDPITQLLYQHDYVLAIDQAKAALSRSGGLSLRLYQCGLAQLAIADATGEMNYYKDAGINFMRVVLYFPATRPYNGASLMGAGYVHEKIGRPDKAADLYQRAKETIDPDHEPQLVQRLDQLIKGRLQQNQP